jgi:putative DNA primase/helicase
LAYAARGWPVFPCNPKNKKPLLARDIDPATRKPIPNSGGVTKATTDAEQIKAWWAKWPRALIGLATGHPTIDAGGLRLFVVDFDPRVDPDTGEVWTLERLESDLEAQLGEPLPPTLAALTPSDGVHAYLLQDDDGPAITNRGNLPEHVDVRGLGGYVIAPPSIMGANALKGQAGLKYCWHRKEPVGGIARAPARLIAILRERKDGGSATARPSAPARPLPADMDDAAREAVRKYAMSGLDRECEAVRTAGSGQRNAQLNESALKIASLVASGALEETIARQCLEAAARANPGRDDDRQLIDTINSGWSAGTNNPRDLGEIAAAARDRASRGSGSRPRSPSPPPRPPHLAANGAPSSRMGESGGDRGERGSGGEAEGDVTRKCAFRPHTDLGNLERFLERYGGDFLYVEAWGWLRWDGRRWNRDMAAALLSYSVQQTVRAIQGEAAFIRESGWKRDEAPMLFKDQERDRGLDYIAKWKGKEAISFSATIAAWGRNSESAGHISCIPKMAEARLSAMPADFDADPLLLNMQSGTLVFTRGGEGVTAAVAEREHRREDRITKIGVASFDPKATCPLFDAFLETVQPTEDMRDFLDTWAGYSSLGLADAQKMAVFYGEGSNGKGVWVNVIAHILGDYAWSTGIETFIDAGRVRKGADASPDLAALAGRRMVYANEPEDNSKFADGLIKSLTSDEPKGGVRELLKAPFELQITFNNTVMANNIPKISTDHGIQRRVQIVPWGVIIPDEEQDLLLKAKLKVEADGILNRMVRGALRYLSEGLSLPEAVKEATREYQAENDLLGGFIRLCVARVKGETVGATPLHRLFVAWQTWANQLPQSGKPWSAKHLNTQMQKKSFKITKSSTMKWQDIALRFDELDFVTIDEKGTMRPVEKELPAPRRFEGEDVPKGAQRPDPPPDDDDCVPF